MTQISRLKEAEISDGNAILAEDLGAEFDQLVSESNAQDTRIEALEGNTFTNQKTFNAGLKTDTISEKTSAAGVTADGVRLKDNMVKVAGTPVDDGEYGYISNQPKVKVNGTVQTIIHTGNGDSALPAQTGNSGEFLTTNGTASSWAMPAFGVPYDSGELAISNTGAHTLTHGFGAKPKLIQYFLVCKSAQHNHAVGDEVPVTPTTQVTSGNCGFGVIVTATEIKIRFVGLTNPMIVYDATSGVAQFATNASWRLIVRAAL